MNKIKLLVAGATVSGVALACERAEGCLLVEQGMLLGAEYLAGMNAKPYAGEPLGAQAGKLLAECRALDLLGEGGEVHLPPVQGLLANRLQEAGVRTLLHTRITDILPAEGGYLVELFGAQGFCRLWAERVVDTREDGQGRKALCAALHFSGEAVPRALPGAQLLRGRYRGDCVLKLPVPREASWPQARDRLWEYWERNAPPGGQLAAVAPNFVFDYDRAVTGPEANGLIRCVSASFANLFAAYEGGIACACTR